MAVECLVSRDVIRQPGHVAEESITATADGLGDGRETSGRGDLLIADKLVPYDLQQLSLALHVESLKGSGVNREEGSGFSSIHGSLDDEK